MKRSAPVDAQGHSGGFTPEDVFVAAANTCIMMMFIWVTKRFKLKLLSYEYRSERTKLVELDRTELFTHPHQRGATIRAEIQPGNISFAARKPH